MSTKKLQIGIIGCGMVANIGHLPAYHQSPLAEVTAISDPLESHRKKVKDKFHVSNIYKEAEDLIDDPSIDAISICSPHWVHAEQVIRAAKNGKHILCEKPIGVNLEEVDDMIKAVERNKVIFQTATQKRFDFGFQFLKEQIIKQSIGKIFQASVFWYHSMPNYLGQNMREDLIQEIGLWRLTDERCGGGDLLDHGPHYFDLFRWWFGEVDTVSAEIRRINKKRVNEDHSIITLAFKDSEQVAIFERSEAVFGEVFGREGGRLHGIEGTYYFDVPSEYKKKPMTISKFYRKNKTSKPVNEQIQFSNNKKEHAYSREVRSFINQVLGRSNEEVNFPMEWIPTIYDGRAALEIVLASYESQRINEKIKLPLKNYQPISWKQKGN